MRLAMDGMTSLEEPASRTSTATTRVRPSKLRPQRNSGWPHELPVHRIHQRRLAEAERDRGRLDRPREITRASRGPVRERDRRGRNQRHEPGRRIEAVFGTNSLKNVASFTRQMSVLISSGTPIVQSLEAVERQTIDQKWKAVLKGCASVSRRATRLSDAMSAYPNVFDDVYRAMIAAGESGGGFDKILARLSKLVRRGTRGAEQCHRGDGLSGAC